MVAEILRPKEFARPSERLPARERVARAERAFVAMVEERKKVQNLLLEACLKLEKYNFTCEAGPLANCKEFRDIKAFARGVPEVVRPPLESMPLNGKRWIKASKTAVGENKIPQTTITLECGHEYTFTPIVDRPSISETMTSGGRLEVPRERLKNGERLGCQSCIDLLQAREMYRLNPND